MNDRTKKIVVNIALDCCSFVLDTALATMLAFILVYFPARNTLGKSIPPALSQSKH